MQESDLTYAPAESPRPKRRRSLIRRFVLVYYIVFALLLLALVPPYISVSRYQSRIAESISQSLGRPAHLDKVTLNLLPFPSLTIDNLVVTEDPAFGYEPVIRANSVRATFRVQSLLRRKVEFSSISFTEPSINLVHLPNGKWNLESILTQAARIQTAPTAQKSIGPAPRFPYIEATGARINLKLGQEKVPISLNDAEFALWLPNPQQWHLRIEAHPARTDISVSDTGILRLEGTLGRASTLAEVPIDLAAEWSTAPLGGATQLLLGRDAGIRGDLALSAHTQGTIGNSAVTAHLHLDKLRRADFVPQSPLTVDITCRSAATNSFHSFPDPACAWTPTGSSQPITLTGTIPDIRDLDRATATLTTDALPIASTLDWLRILSTRVPADLTAGGSLNIALQSTASLTSLPANWDTTLNATIEAAGLTIASPQSGLETLNVGDLELHATPSSAVNRTITRTHRPTGPPTSGILLTPITLDLGGKGPATLEARIDSTGYTLHLSGMVLPSLLTALGKALPQLGDGLEDCLDDTLPDPRPTTPIHIDLTATHTWGGQHTWLLTSTIPPPPPLNHPPPTNH
jgi:uncharacterized protein involved in outer membrane biogenesis